MAKEVKSVAKIENEAVPFKAPKGYEFVRVDRKLKKQIHRLPKGSFILVPKR